MLERFAKTPQKPAELAKRKIFSTRHHCSKFPPRRPRDSRKRRQSVQYRSQEENPTGRQECKERGSAASCPVASQLNKNVMLLHAPPPSRQGDDLEVPEKCHARLLGGARRRYLASRAALCGCGLMRSSSIRSSLHRASAGQALLCWTLFSRPRNV